MKRVVFLSVLLILCACGTEDATYNGYVEGEYVYIAPTTAGLLETLSVTRGQEVDKGAALFRLDQTGLEAQRLSAVADIDKAKAALESASKEYERQKALAPSGASSRAAIEAQKATLEAAKTALESAKQKLVEIKKKITDSKPLTPAAGRIENTYFRVGEYVDAGKPVVSLLPPENVKVRFFVPQAALPQLPVGTKVKIHCDGCTARIPAHITFIASQSEYTPPVIYSVGSRDKLVFMLEAIPDTFDPQLHPGLPVDIVREAP